MRMTSGCWYSLFLVVIPDSEKVWSAYGAGPEVLRHRPLEAHGDGLGHLHRGALPAAVDTRIFYGNDFIRVHAGASHQRCKHKQNEPPGEPHRQSLSKPGKPAVPLVFPVSARLIVRHDNLPHSLGALVTELRG